MSHTLRYHIEIIEKFLLIFRLLFRLVFFFFFVRISTLDFRVKGHGVNSM